jgi:hypothetical protein
MGAGGVRLIQAATVARLKIDPGPVLSRVAGRAGLSIGTGIAIL